MLCYEIIDISERIDPNKSSKSKECMICHYWFFNHAFKFQDFVCNSCHDLIMLCLKLSDITVITVIIHNISKSEAINLIESAVSENRGYIKKYCLNFQSIQFFYFFCLVYIKLLILWTSVSL